MSEAASGQATEEVFEMLERGHNTEEQDQDGNTAMHWAAWFKSDALLFRLLDAGGKPDACNLSNETPVHWAAKAMNLAALDGLTKVNRNLLSMRDIDGFSPFILSAQHDSPAIMEWMFMKGVSIEEQDNHGRTALHWACYKGYRKTCQWLLSRNATIVHRDHEGTTCLHWAALRGHLTIADDLLEVGAVHLIDCEDAGGDTPMILAQRKKNTFLVLQFIKCQILQKLIGRAYLSKNTYANFFLLFKLMTNLIFFFIITPGIWEFHFYYVISWSVLSGGAVLLWLWCANSDPGWLQEQTIWPQTDFVGKDPMAGFDYVTPIESQMAYHDMMKDEICEIWGDDELGRLEVEQQKLNYMRCIVVQTRQRLEDSCPRRRDPWRGTIAKASTDADLAPHADATVLRQLAAAHDDVRRKEGAIAEAVSRARVERLVEEGGAEYLMLLERGDFKSICVVCRAVKTMRSHHCKEAGRCVERLDHHCPWIDNCVGIGNQRPFFCFIVVLWLAICLFWYGAFFYFVDVVIPDVERDSVGGVFNALVHGEWSSGFKAVAVVGMSAFNFIWFVFVGMLVGRHTLLMAVNVTTFETLVRPPHVVKRFPRAKDKLWYVSDFSIYKLIPRLISYWTCSMDRDKKDFKQGPSSKSGVVGGDHLEVARPGSGSSSGSSRGQGQPLMDDRQASHHSAGHGSWNYHLVAPDAANNV